jgi:hypothetical protein
MTSQAIKLKVTASVPKDCIFQLEDDGWNGVCGELSVTVQWSSFEDTKRKMERHYKRTSRMRCVSILEQVERRLPDRCSWWRLDNMGTLEIFTQHDPIRYNSTRWRLGQQT